MSTSAPAPQVPATAEAIAVAIGRAERRMWLLNVMIEFCAALVEALSPGGLADRLPVWDKAFFAIARATRLAIGLEMETRRRLRDLKAGILPAPKADATPEKREEPEEPEGRDQLDETGEASDREPREPTESSTAFRARLEDLEALLDEGVHADWLLPETIRRLCRVLGVKPEWSDWLGRDWLEENLDLRQAPPLSPPAGGSTAPRVARSARPRINSSREGGAHPTPAFALLASASTPALIHNLPPSLRGFPPPRHALE